LALRSRSHQTLPAGFTTSPPSRRIRTGALLAAVIPAASLLTTEQAKAAPKPTGGAVTTGCENLTLLPPQIALPVPTVCSLKYVEHFSFLRIVNSGALHHFSTHPPLVVGRPSSVVRRSVSYQVETGINTPPRVNNWGTKPPFIRRFRVDTRSWCGSIPKAERPAGRENRRSPSLSFRGGSAREFTEGYAGKPTKGSRPSRSWITLAERLS
jgi:hypothetical protein